MDITQIKKQIKEGFFPLGNDDLYDCFYSLFDDNIVQFEESIKIHYGRKISRSEIIPSLYDFSLNTDNCSVEILIEKNIDLLTNLLKGGHDISEYLTNMQNKLEIFKKFLESPSHLEFLQGRKFPYTCYISDNKNLIKKLDENLSKLREISQSTSTPINDSIGSRSAIYDSQVSSNYGTEIPPPPPRPVSHDNGWLGGVNSSPVQIPHLGHVLSNSYIGVPSSILSYPSASLLIAYSPQFYPPRSPSDSYPVYLQSQPAHPFQSSSASYPFYSQSQPAHPFQSPSDSYPVYLQSQPAHPFQSSSASYPFYSQSQPAHPSQSSSASYPFYSQSQPAHPSQSSSASYPFYSQSQPAHPFQSSSASYPFYSQILPVQTYGQHPITQSPWNRAYYSLQNTKTYQQAPCSLNPIATNQSLYYYQNTAQHPISYPSPPFTSSPPQTAFQYVNLSWSSASAPPARVLAPISINHLREMTRVR